MTNRKRSRPHKFFAGFPALKPQNPTQAISGDICENPKFCEKLIASMMSSDNPNRCIRISVDIGHLSIAARRAAPAHLGITAGDPLQDLTSSDDRLHCKIIVELKAPALMIGDLHEYGTSVYAHGRAALELVRIELARVGIPKNDLDSLTTKHVSIISVPISYVFCCDGPEEAAEFSLALNRRTRLLGLTIGERPFPFSTEWRGFLPENHSTTNTTNDAQDCDVPREVSITKSYHPGRKVLQLELEVDTNFLKSRNWVPLDSWRDAYAEKRYETIFNEIVRGLFRLDVPNRYTTPVIKPNAQSMIPPVDSIFRDYLLGKNPMDFSGFRPDMSNYAKKKRVNGYRDQILDEYGIDILIEWRIHQTMQSAFLNDKLRYRDDFQPETKFVPSHFCKLNWKYILKQLRQNCDELTCEGLAQRGAK